MTLEVRMKLPTFETLLLSAQDGIGRLTLNRPEKRNAMSQTMFEELGLAADAVRDEPGIKVLVITGAGGAFSAGIDLGSLDVLKDSDVNAFRVTVRRIQRNFRAFELMEKPVIAMVDGYCLGAGTELMLACDMILASSRSVFGLLEVNLGLVTDLGATQRLPRFVGIHRAKELILTGKKIDATEADRIGLINALYEPDDLEEETMRLAGQLASLPAVPVGLCKIAIDRSRDGSMETGLEFEAQSQALCFVELMEKMKQARSEA